MTAEIFVEKSPLLEIQLCFEAAELKTRGKYQMPLIDDEKTTISKFSVSETGKILVGEGVH